MNNSISCEKDGKLLNAINERHFFHYENYINILKSYLLCRLFSNIIFSILFFFLFLVDDENDEILKGVQIMQKKLDLKNKYMRRQKINITIVLYYIDILQ